jgi:hypothetical protein
MASTRGENLQNKMKQGVRHYMKVSPAEQDLKLGYDHCGKK